MSNPFANVPVRGGSYLKFEMPGVSHQGIIKGTRIGTSLPDPQTKETRPVPEIILDVAGEERILGCENAALNNWAVQNGEQIAASIGQVLTVTHTGKAGQVKLYECQIGGTVAPAAVQAEVPQAAPAVAPTTVPTAPPVVVDPSSVA